MNATKIGVVEDEIIIAYDIQVTLAAMGYNVFEPCCDHTSAIRMLTNDNPDLVILDINLGGKQEGIEIAKYIRSKADRPFIYLTANSDPATVETAKKTMPDAYLVKPFNKESLFSAIEIALYNFNNGTRAVGHTNAATQVIAKDFVFVKDGEYFHKVLFDDILFMESDHNYVTIHTSKRKLLARATLQEFMGNFNLSRFVRVHRSFVVNISKAGQISADNIIVEGYSIPVSNTYRDAFMAALNIK